MTAMERDPLADLERHRVRLEENVAKIRQALKHWKTWELEYEMLKEEIQLKQDPNSFEMLEIGRSLGGDLVNEKEVEELLGRDRLTKRNATQVAEMISRRVDYVQQNITTVEKQLQAAEKKLAAATALLEPALEDEEGLPLTDIHEELDDDGNVISSTLSQPGKAAPEIVGALQKAGLTDPGRDITGDSSSADGEPFSSSNALPGAEMKIVAEDATNGSSAPNDAIEKATSSKKLVSFTDDTKQDPSMSKTSGLTATGYNEALADYTFNRGNKVIEVDDYEEEIASYPVIPQDESPEDSALRREMLQYGLSEVGQVVAEIDLEGRDDDYSDEGMDDDEEYDSDEDEDDEYGRSTRPVLTEEYKRQMMELEEKLNAQMLENLGPRPDTHPLAEYADDVRKLMVQKDETESEPMNKSGPTHGKLESKKKGVRFADNLDISPALQPVQDNDRSRQPAATSIPTMSETIVERTGPTPQPPSAVPPKSAKVSRFKSSRATFAQPASNGSSSQTDLTSHSSSMPQGPPGRTLATSVVEHAPDSSNTEAPDELDPALLNREVQVEYHKMRNRIIQKQGGFTSKEDDEEPLMEEKDGKVKKVSRFRAARLKADGA
ncbi:hypothetical protein K469DRAFT_715047 [Zopfia rhizophila CBS 207.26]|uniref:DUF3835 domain-containing protein n=1 Tax=Zopfia rhizophila CBS 207.26 TaxID=1314779 RepID=A0A6A6ESG0_9PEZI|nr:hypothetical protein K469DRAFT_715047 [Zopfia rhizophila CBS 207.26]